MNTSRSEPRRGLLWILLGVVLLVVAIPGFPPSQSDTREAIASGGTVTAPAAPSFALSTANQDPGDFVISGFASTDTLLVSIGFVNPPPGTTFQLPSTAGLTAGTGYNFTGGKTQISFTGTMANANAALAAMTVSTGATDGSITIRVSASINRANLYYNPINGHYYEYVARPSTYAWSATASQSAFDLADSRTLYGVRGYLATITSAQEQKFVFSNINATNIWIGATDDASLLNQVMGAGTFANQAAAEGMWHWVSGPEAGQKFWQGATGGLWVHQQTNAAIDRITGNAAVARYENWCNGNASPEFTLTAGRSMGEPNNWSGAEHFILEKWSGAACWNDYGTKDGSPQSGYLVEYSENWGTGANERGSFSGADVATADVTALVDNVPRNVSGARSGSNAIEVSWTAPSSGTVDEYLVTSTPGSRTCTAVAPATTCTVTGLTSGTSYTFVVRATFSDTSTKTSLASAAVIADNGTAPTVTLVTESIKSSGSASLTSDEAATGYLVKSTISVTNVASITGAPGSQWNQVNIPTAGVAVTVSATGLVEGTYKAYAVDVLGNLSAASSGTVTVDDTPPTVTLSAASATSTTTSVQFRVTGNEAIDCSSLSRTEGVDFTLTNISSISSIAQTSTSVCTVNAVSTATAGGTTVTSTLGVAGSFSVVDSAGNAQTVLTGAPQSVSVSIPAPTTTTAPPSTSPPATAAPTSGGDSTAPTNGGSNGSSGLPNGAFIVGPTTSTTQVQPASTTTSTQVVPVPEVATTSSIPTTTSTTTTLPATVAVATVPDGLGSDDAPQAPTADPGQIAVQVGGRDVSALVLRQDDQIEVSVLGTKIVLNGVTIEGNKVPLDASGSINLDEARRVRIAASGFSPESEVGAWVMSTPVPLGVTRTDAEGSVDALYQFPESVEAGDHRLVVDGRNQNGEQVVISLGVRAASTDSGAPWSRVFVLILLLGVAGGVFIPAALRRKRPL